MHQKRKIIVTLERQKDEMIAALWANSNWDDDKGSRKSAISDINQNFGEALEAIEDAMRQKNRPEEEKLTDSNPFFAATERGLAKVEQRVKEKGIKIEKPPVAKPVESEEAINYMKGLDQE